MTVMPSRAQVNNDNEDGVYKVNQRFREGNNFVPGQVIVRFKDSSPANVRRAKGRFVSAGFTDVDAVLKQFGVKKMDKLFPNAVHKAPAALRKTKAPDGSVITESNMDQVYMVETKSQYSDSTLQLVKALNSLDKVEYAEPNYIAYISGGPTSNATAMEINSAAEPDDNNGFVNDIHGWDFINNTGKIRDYNSHGTHCAGIAAACNNGIGIIGANPKALIMPVTVMQSDGTGKQASCTVTVLNRPYIITYMVDGKEYKRDTVVYSEPVTPLAEPSKEGYTFSGWSEIPTTMPAKDVVITGSFEKDYEPEDANHDGLVDTGDVLDVYGYMQNAAGSTGEGSVYDVNGDGQVDTQDVLTIYNCMSNE